MFWIFYFFCYYENVLGGVLKNKGIRLTKSILLTFAVFVLVSVLSISIYFTVAYFLKNRENRGYIEFSPGIFLDFNADTVEIDENDPTNWQLLYYANNNLNSDPVVLDTENEPAGPATEYYVLSPSFKCGANGLGQSATIVARAKLNYNFISSGEELSQEQLNYLFNQSFGGQKLNFDSSWVEYDGWFYYVGNNNVQAITSAEDLAEIEYSPNAEDISVFETNNDGIALIKLANQEPETYPEGFESFYITLTMEFVETTNNWLN